MPAKTLEAVRVSRETSEPGETPECKRVDDSGVSCGKPLDTTGYPLWCKACRAAHRRGYESTRDEMSETRGYAAGASAVQAALVALFSAYGGMTFNGTMAAKWVQNFKLQK